MDGGLNPNVTEATDDEEQICRFSGWCSKTGYSLEYWEVFVTDRRLILCIIGESYSSLLLKADMGASLRDRLSTLGLSEIATFDERNVVVPAADVRSIELTRGTLTQKASLRLEWDEGEMTLYNVPDTASEADAVDNVTAISTHDAYAAVSTTIAGSQNGPFQTLGQLIRSFST